MATQVKAKPVLDAAVRAGIPETAPGLKANARIPLGTASVHPIDMADAYATFAAGGQQAPWYVVTEVRGDNDGLLYQAKPSAERVFDPDVMADLTYALGQVVNGAGRHRLGGPGAGPPGGRQDRHRGAAAGHDDLGVVRRLHARSWPRRWPSTRATAPRTSTASAGCRRSSAGRYPAQIWTDFMTGALKGEPVERFPARAGVGTPVNPTPTPTPTPTPHR